MGIKSAHLFVRNCTEGSSRSHSSLILHSEEFKFEFLANGENCGHFEKLSKQDYFFNLEILPLMLNKCIINL